MRQNDEQEIKQENEREISNKPPLINKPRVLCPYCKSEVKGVNNYCFKCGKNTKKKENSNSLLYIIISIIGGVIAFYVNDVSGYEHSQLVFALFISLVLVIFACYKKPGVFSCFGVVWVLFCIWVYIKYS